MEEITYQNVFEKNVMKTEEDILPKQEAGEASEGEKEFYSLFIVKDNCVLLCEDHGYFYFPTYPKEKTFAQIRRDLFQKGFYSINEDNSLLYFEKFSCKKPQEEETNFIFYLSGSATEDFLSEFSNASFVPMDEVANYLSTTISLDGRRGRMDHTIINCVKTYLGQEKDSEKGKLKLKEL